MSKKLITKKKKKEKENKKRKKKGFTNFPKRCKTASRGGMHNQQLGD
jgi:hypothetical protein